MHVENWSFVTYTSKNVENFFAKPFLCTLNVENDHLGHIQIQAVKVGQKPTCSAFNINDKVNAIFFEIANMTAFVNKLNLASYCIVQLCTKGLDASICSG